MSPSLLHEAPIQIRLQPNEVRILLHRANERSCRSHVRCAVKDEISGVIDRQREVAVLGVLLRSRFRLELPPWVSFCEKGFDVRTRADPWRVADLKVEATPCEDGGEVESPVEEALLIGHALSGNKPGVLRCDPVDIRGEREGQVIALGLIEFVPA